MSSGSRFAPPSSRLKLPRLDFALSEIPSLIADLIHEMQLTIEEDMAGSLI